MSEKKHLRRVREIMSRDVVTLSSEDTIHDALEMLIANRVSALPVIDRKNHCVGILSTTDLLDFTHDVEDEMLSVEELEPSPTRSWLTDQLIQMIGKEPISHYMSKDVDTIEMESSVSKAAHEMVRNRIHHLPVIDSNNRLVGIISTMDVLAEVADGEAV